MYEDKVLDMVSQTIPVYRRQEGGKQMATQPTGHFTCRRCPTRPMSPTRRYVTARVVNFEDNDNVFQFIYSPHDAPYMENRTLLQAKLAAAKSNNWTYTNGEEWNDSIIQVRGYWVDEEFQHVTGAIRLGDYIEVHEMEDPDDGGMFWPEMAINTWMPRSNGAYYGIPDIGELVRMGKDQLHASMTIAKASPMAKMRLNAGWTLHDPSTRRTKKKKTTAHEVVDAETARRLDVIFEGGRRNRNRYTINTRDGDEINTAGARYTDTA